ncbi:glycine cleavage system aminomethyltransferase GcvT [Fervidibacillus halotolerans]|uniref:Aminomethyltransferase n=1 Tax=Fervidibacillus halotolerans TaxID=2980027 RepID=A0A9E8LXF0_9BACI|nr:glycine cleavage system aminomethyltransferase GcvT [Fervidibacillus halotolerans]WAA11440.1 glycine cleavage system aminomethyltransferase GcvT [Fervidibacillus halotolerans]
MDKQKQTPLYDVYKEKGVKLIDFGGWQLPVQFTSIKEEHLAVRTKAGLFDVSHMGEILVSGKNSESFLQRLLTNDVSKLATGKAQYTLMCNEEGGTIDDLLVYRLSPTTFLLVVNAANTYKDYHWFLKQKSGDVTIEDKSDQYGQLAIQGPFAEGILQKLVKNISLSEIPFFGFRADVEIGEVKVMVSRSGYTGEDGFELYCRSEDTPYLWNLILTNGKKEGLLPCGLGARDTLRFEACLPLYGQELAEDISPIEAGLGFFVKTNKESDFFGKDVLQKQKQEGSPRKLVGLEMIDRGIPRHGYKVYDDEREIGFITSGTQSPLLKKNIALALIDAHYATSEEMYVEIRNKKLKAKIVPTPFYKRKKE